MSNVRINNKNDSSEETFAPEPPKSKKKEELDLKISQLTISPSGMFSQQPAPEGKYQAKSRVNYRCYLDFDGTLTGIAGSQCVNSKFFKSLQINPDNYYFEAKFKSDIVQRLKDTFDDAKLEALKQSEGLSDKDIVLIKQMRMTPSAKAFLHSMLDKKAEIVIVSRNVRDYIQAVLNANGFSPAKFTILDVNQGGGRKKEATATFEGKQSETIADVIIIADDDAGDFNNMCDGVKSKRSDAVIVGKNTPAGQFDFQALEHDATEQLEKLAAAAPKI